MNMDSKNSWICPNDRELTLRARLETGWSVKGNQIQNISPKNDTINDSEQKVIIRVIEKAKQMERQEKDRISRMLDRLNNMKRNARGDGKHTCVLCSDQFGLFGAQGRQCKDCLKSVCNKCGVDTLTADNEPLWLCKLCSETRELWKKSGAWFSNVMPLGSARSSHTPSIPSINSPINDTNGDNVDNVSQTSSLHSTSPVLRRKPRSPSPMSNRNRSPHIVDYSMMFDGEKVNNFYDHISQEEYANLSTKQTYLYSDMDYKDAKQ
ncbi:rab effector Noc2-like [Oppia nitens]|uniref:rab effector Noc2-like n=1 Tax=Oppia nitens TaxID=1686743 RepID=UPI0023DA4234|nr:rab effector Noc2-like [Oppia nitens]